MKILYDMKIKSTNDYINFILASTSMPVLMRYKPACLVNFQKSWFKDAGEFLRIIVKLERQYRVDILFLHEGTGQYFVLIYHIEDVKTIIENNRMQSFLAEYGYRELKSATEYLNFFKIHYSDYQEKKCGFPDELGIFLGYPIEDVIAYIENQGKNYLLCGYWKVYGDVKKAVQTFELYKELQRQAVEVLNSGEMLANIVCRQMI